MKKLFPFLMFGLLVFNACKKENGSSNVDSTGVVVVEKTVNADGASMTIDAFTVDIPKNAFSTATSISLSKASDKPFGTNQKSDIYFVNNLPENIYSPIILSMSGFKETDDVKILIVEKSFISSLNKEVLNYRFAPHVYVNGKLQISMSVSSCNNTKSAEIVNAGSNPMAVGILAVASHATYISAQGHFRITFPSSALDGAMDLAQYLEEAYTNYSSSPLTFSYAARTTWPVEVSLCPLENTVYGYMSASVWGDNSASMSFNLNKISDKAELRITAGHEFMHFVQNLYDPRNRFSKAKIAPAQLWIDEATAVWAEYMYSTAPNYISDVRKGNEMSPFGAIIKVATDGASLNGYGMSAMVKYLVAQQGVGIVTKIYEKVLAGEKPAEAIRLATGKSYYEWYGQFMDQYVRGKIYSDLAISGLVGNKSDGFTITAAKDSVKSYISQYGQLQSKIYITNLNADAFSPTASLEFQIKSPNTEMLNVYKFNNSTIENVGQHLNFVSIPNIKTIAQDGYKILTLVTNQKYDYTSDAAQNIELITRVKERKGFKSFSISMGTYCYYKMKYSNGTSNTGSKSYTLYMQGIPCTQKDNIIIASWDGTYEYPRKGTATFTLNSNNTVDFTIEDVGDLGAAITTSSISGTAVPQSYDGVMSRTYQVADSYSVLQSASFKSVYSGFTDETTGFFNDSNSGPKSLRIDFNY